MHHILVDTVRNTKVRSKDFEFIKAYMLINIQDMKK